MIEFTAMGPPCPVPYRCRVLPKYIGMVVDTGRVVVIFSARRRRRGGAHSRSPQEDFGRTQGACAGLRDHLDAAPADWPWKAVSSAARRVPDLALRLRLHNRRYSSLKSALSTRNPTRQRSIWGSECLLAPSGRILAPRAQAARKPRRHPPRARRIHLSPAVSRNELRCDPSPLPGLRISKIRETTEGSAELEFRIQFPPAESLRTFGC